MKSRVVRVALLLFGSGFTALVYQVVWMRELRLIFGFSTASSAAVIAIFLGGIGVGSVVLGRRANRSERPLHFFGRIELAIAVSAAATPALIWLARQAYTALGGSFQLGMTVGTLVRLVLSALVLCVPTVLMGGSLPAASRAVGSDDDVERRRLGLIYGANTAGAVAGALVSTFFLLEALGNQLTLWLACGINALVALAAISLGAKLFVRDSEASESAAPAPRAARKPGAPPAGPGERKAPDARIPGLPPRRLVFVSAAVVGFVFLLMELVWYRMLSPLLGGSTYTFGLILAVALLGIGIGAAIYARGGRRSATLSAFATTCALEAVCLAAPYAVGDGLALFAILTRPIGGLGFLGVVAAWTQVTAIVVLPAAIVAGYQFPLLVALLGRGRPNVAEDVGNAYAWNTAGTIVGSLAGGFGLLPLLTAPGTWKLCVFALVVLGGLLAAVSLKRERPGWRLAPAAGLLAASLVLAAATGPTAAWRHSPIGAGRVEFNAPNHNRLQEWLRTERRQLRWEADGRESGVGLLALDLGLAFAVSGKVDGSAVGDASTQVMSGLVGAILHPLAKSALVIGLGTGSTAGWLGAVPSIARVDVVEIEPAILHVARECEAVNQNVLDNKKVRVLIGDARELLLTSRDRYDVIFSEPSNPYRAGISSLFTQEFYEAVRRRLAPDGIFVQWLQAYEVDSQTVRTAYATLASVFPSVETWCTKNQDLLLVASAGPIRYPAATMRERVRTEPYKSALSATWRVTELEGFLSHFVARDSLTRSIALAEKGVVNTDDRNLVEFAFARSVGQGTLFSSDELRHLARSRDEDRPVVDGAVDWDNVDRQRLASLAAEGAEGSGAGRSPVWDRRSAVFAAFAGGNIGEVRRAWKADPWEPVGALELAMVGEALADGGDESSLVLAKRLQELQPAEAEGIVARFLWTRSDWKGCFAATKAAFERYRVDPWPLPYFMKRLLAVAASLPGKDPSLSAPLDALLAPRFSVSLIDEDRNLARLTIAQGEGASAIVEAMQPLEPHFPWSGEFLDLRARAYEETRDPRAESARRDAVEFHAREPIPFDSGLSVPAGPPVPPPPVAPQPVKTP